MSWFSNYHFGEYSHEGTAIYDSYDKPITFNMREEEVVSGIHYRDNTVQLELNIHVEDSYAKHGQ
ncbi:hypothetical protein Hanom_Chr08g00711511 [Helianthus anomalus]